MRCQRAEYMMLPPLQPEYDDTGELTETVSFNAALMNEASGSAEQTNEELEAANATVRVVLFPLVLRKGDEEGKGEDEIVVTPAQVLVAAWNGRRAGSSSKGPGRLMTPISDAGGAALEARSLSGGGGSRSPARGAESSVKGGAGVAQSDLSVEMEGAAGGYL
jgi:hypothetical protein